MTGLHSCSASLRQHKADKETSSKVFGSVTILCFVWTSPGFTEANSSLASDSSVTKDGLKELKFLVVVHVHRWSWEKSKSHLLLKKPVPKLWATDAVSLPYVKLDYI